VEELMEERGVSVDHATINRCVVQYSPQREHGAAGGERRTPIKYPRIIHLCSPLTGGAPSCASKFSSLFAPMKAGKKP
jgi:hypothetical protein